MTSFLTPTSAVRQAAEGLRQICPHSASPCLYGIAICGRLCAAVALARPLLAAEFELRGEVQVSTCHQPCRLAFRSTRDAVLCLGDVEPEADLDQILAGNDCAGSHAGPVILSSVTGGTLQ
jgi:hypothetical protein